MKKSEKVIVLGASTNEERYSNMAIKLLTKNNHSVIPVNPKEKTIEGLEVVNNLSEIKETIDTLTVYVKPKILAHEIDNIIAISPKRVIFNPGTEDTELQKLLEANEIICQQACTLVLLNTDQY
jgi:predicted CoA-binding protein